MLSLHHHLWLTWHIRKIPCHLKNSTVFICWKTYIIKLEIPTAIQTQHLKLHFKRPTSFQILLGIFYCQKSDFPQHLCFFNPASQSLTQVMYNQDSFSSAESLLLQLQLSICCITVIHGSEKLRDTILQEIFT